MRTPRHALVAALLALLAVVVAPLGCSGSSSSSGTTCCTAKMGGDDLCVCGVVASGGITCTSGPSGVGCSITCTQDGTSQSETSSGTVTVTCSTGSDGGSGGCGDYHCWDPLKQRCVYDGDACSAAQTVCADGSCQACGAAGQPCCPARQCANGCCFSGTEKCVAKGAWCGIQGGGEVCADTGSCTSCGAYGHPCCPGDTCSSADYVCAGGDCTPCGGLGEPCCTQKKPCADTLTCNGGQCG